MQCDMEKYAGRTRDSDDHPDFILFKIIFYSKIIILYVLIIPFKPNSQSDPKSRLVTNSYR
jgi:hypothetical protein